MGEREAKALRAAVQNMAQADLPDIIPRTAAGKARIKTFVFLGFLPGTSSFR